MGEGEGSRGDTLEGDSLLCDGDGEVETIFTGEGDLETVFTAVAGLQGRLAGSLRSSLCPEDGG